MKIEELEEDIIKAFEDRVSEKMIPVEVKYMYQSVETQKVLVSLKKVPDPYKFATGKDILVQVNPVYFDAFTAKDEKIIEILFDQSIDNISFNPENGALKLKKPTFSANKGIIDKYSYDDVARAVEAEKLFEEQQADAEKKKKDDEKSKNSEGKKSWKK